jgi:hypothetical protein
MRVNLTRKHVIFTRLRVELLRVGVRVGFCVSTHSVDTEEKCIGFFLVF